MSAGTEDAVTSVRESAAEREAEAEAELEEQGTTWARIQGKLTDISQTVTVVGQEIEMQPAGTDATIRALEEAQGLADEELDELEAAARGEADADGIEELAQNSDDVARLMTIVADLLDEFCVDESMTRERWGKIPPQFLMSAFEEWSQRRLSPAEIERVNSFRGE